VSILDWIRRRGNKAAGGQRRARLDEAIEQIVQTANPRLRLAKRYRERLGPVVEAALGYADACAEVFAPPLTASAAAWTSDPALNAFFANSDELTRAFARSRELRAYFDGMAQATHTVAVLGMALAERQVMGLGMEGEVLHCDVAQTTLSFSDHRVRMCTDSEQALRRALAGRVVEQLALQALACITAGESRRRQLEGERSALSARLRLLQRQDVGFGPMFGAKIRDDRQEWHKLAAQLARNERELQAVGSGADTLERQLEQVRDVLSDPAQQVGVVTRRVRLTRMNVVLPTDTAEPSSEIEFQVVRYGDNRHERAVATVHFARSELAPASTAMNEAVLKELDSAGITAGRPGGCTGPRFRPDRNGEETCIAA
jgi:hypothetical protein